MIYESSRTTTEQMLSDSRITGFFRLCVAYVWYETVRIVNIYDRQKTHSLSVASNYDTSLIYFRMRRYRLSKTFAVFTRGFSGAQQV